MDLDRGEARAEARACLRTYGRCVQCGAAEWRAVLEYRPNRFAFSLPRIPNGTLAHSANNCIGECFRLQGRRHAVSVWVATCFTNAVWQDAHSHWGRPAI